MKSDNSNVMLKTDQMIGKLIESQQDVPWIERSMPESIKHQFMQQQSVKHTPLLPGATHLQQSLIWRQKNMFLCPREMFTRGRRCSAFLHSNISKHYRLDLGYPRRYSTWSGRGQCSAPGGAGHHVHDGSADEAKEDRDHRQAEEGDQQGGEQVHWRWRGGAGPWSPFHWWGTLFCWYRRLWMKYQGMGLLILDIITGSHARHWMLHLPTPSSGVYHRPHRHLCHQPWKVRNQGDRHPLSPWGTSWSAWQVL